MEKALICGAGSLYSNGMYIGEVQSATILISTNLKSTWIKEKPMDLYDELVKFNEKPKKHKKGKKLKCWENKRFFE